MTPKDRTPDDASRTTRLLITTRFVRSIGQGALAVDFSLYLRALNWSAVAISAVLSAALLVGVVADPDRRPAERPRRPPALSVCL